MAFPTSYTFKSVELNGNTYSIPTADQGIDDLNSATSTWAHRKGNTPVQTNIAVNESVFTLNINIRAIRGETGAQYQAKIDELRALFDTRDPAFYPLYRKQPHESAYRYLSVAPREVAVNRLERRVSVTLETADKIWQDSVAYTQSITLWEDAPRTETMTVAYAGTIPADVVSIDIKALTPGSDGPTPLYFREVTVYSTGNGVAGSVIGFPLKVADGWDTSAEVAAGKMRSDGLDISVTLGGVDLRRIIDGTETARSVWAMPHTWPTYTPSKLIDGPDVGVPSDPALNHRSLTATDTKAYIDWAWNSNLPGDFPSSGKFMIDDEIISYTGTMTWHNTLDPNYHLGDPLILIVTGLTRGVDGTVAASHTRYSPIKMPVVLRINYGYAVDWELVRNNNLNGWPLIDYAQSTNSTWIQTDTYDNNPTTRPWAWRMDADFYAPTYSDEYIEALPLDQQHHALWSRRLKSGVKRHDRLRFNPPSSGRSVSHIRLKMTLFCHLALAPTVARLMTSYGNQAAQEAILATMSTNSTDPAGVAVDTGFIEIGDTPGLFYFVRLDHYNNSLSTPKIQIRLDEFHAKMDQRIWNSVPSVGALGSERGPGTGEYPVHLTIKNTADTANAQTFTLDTKMANNNIVTVSPEERAVSSPLALGEVSYTNPTWLRLVPGTNPIVFTAPPGAGQVLVTITWRERY